MSLHPVIRFLLVLVAVILLAWGGCIVAGWVNVGNASVLAFFAAACYVAGAALPDLR